MSGPDCACDGDRYTSCDVHVGCDDLCGALREPESDEEIRGAFEHWRGHGYLSGCSHGR